MGAYKLVETMDEFSRPTEIMGMTKIIKSCVYARAMKIPECLWIS
jgi:hypothetical protein